MQKYQKLNNKDTIILAIESSCDDTSASVLKNGEILSNITANQNVHKNYGGVVPELASRAHQQNILPVVSEAINQANIRKTEISAIAFTKGPGLLGSLIVGTSFAKGFAQGLNIPLIGVNHLHGHIFAHLIKDKRIKNPTFPFLCLTVSGGHTQIIYVESPFEMKILGETNDDAAGEAFDKSAKILGIPYPGGPLIDKYSQNGNPKAFGFPIPKVNGLNFSFSGLKTSILYFLQKEMSKNSKFIEKNLNDLCASIQYTIVKILIKKFLLASKETGVKELVIAGGVSANSLLRSELKKLNNKGFSTYIPPFEFCTDNAAMIAIVGYYKYLKNQLDDISIVAKSKINFNEF